MAEELGRVTAGYQRWLARQPLSVNTRRTYLGRVRQYSAYLAACVNDYGNPLTDPHARDYAIRDFKSHLKKSIKAKPASVNLTLAALDSLYLFLGLGRSNVRREDLPQEAPRALEPEQQKRFMRAVERCTSIRGFFAYPRKKVQSGISSRLENEPLPILSIVTTTCMISGIEPRPCASNAPFGMPRVS
jgi:hypothetical protein